MADTDSIRKNVYGIGAPMVKTALLEELKAGTDVVLEFLKTHAMLTLLAGIGVGGAAGFGAAKLNAKSDMDMDTVRKAYDNERLSSDIGYLSSRIEQENKDRQAATAPKAMRVFG